MRVSFFCTPGEWPPVVRRIVFDRIPAAEARRYLEPPRGPTITDPLMVATAILGELAVRGALPGPAAFRILAAAVCRQMVRRLHAATAVNVPRVARRLGGASGREIAALLAAAEGHFPA